MNAAKHAYAKRIAVRFSCRERAFILRVTDDGVGMPDVSPGWGHLDLSILRHRANIIGASLFFLRAGNGGTEVRCERGDIASNPIRP